MSRATGRHTRPKKLTAKQNVQIFREDQVDQVTDFDSSRAPIDTGVDKGEEAEYHLQQAIKASQAIQNDTKPKDAYIPTPPIVASDVQYDILYRKGFQQPSTYIRSSSTVEDCAGVPYCMDEEDELALKLINNKLPPGREPCNEDQFEEVMNFFEETAQAKQPFAAVDSPPVLPLEELLDQLDDTIAEFVSTYAPFVYDHWKSRRTLRNNHGIMPRLKQETGQETDDTDPYVCFRRRDIRQIRKTRNRDALSAEKLRKLRLELETARNVLLLVKRREQIRQDVLTIDKQVFDQRTAFRETKRKLGLKGDEDLLINQKRQKLQPGIPPNQAALAQQLRIPIPYGPGPDLRTLEDVRAEKQRGIEHEIQINVDKHVRWNEGFVDHTKTPLTPSINKSFLPEEGHFREAMPATEYLPTPPASVSDEETQPNDTQDVEMKDDPHPSTPFRYASPADDDIARPMPSFRRRIGRGGRVMFDRKFPFRLRKERSEDHDRFKYDTDESDVEDEEEEESIEDAAFARMSQRAYLIGTNRAAELQALSSKRTHSETNHSNISPPHGQSVQHVTAS